MYSTKPPQQPPASEWSPLQLSTTSNAASFSVYCPDIFSPDPQKYLHAVEIRHEHEQWCHYQPSSTGSFQTSYAQPECKYTVSILLETIFIIDVDTIFVNIGMILAPILEDLVYIADSLQRCLWWRNWSWSPGRREPRDHRTTVNSASDRKQTIVTTPRLTRYIRQIWTHNCLCFPLWKPIPMQLGPRLLQAIDQRENSLRRSVCTQPTKMWGPIFCISVQTLADSQYSFPGLYAWPAYWMLA